MYFLAKYNTQTDIEFAMVKRGVVDLAATADWTPATGDTKIVKDGANAANTTNNPSAIGGTGSVTWKITLTASELSAKRVQIQIVDSATKAVEDQFFTVYTYGNASAMFPFDFSDQVRGGLTALPNANAEAAGGLYTRGTGAGQINQPANGMIDGNIVRWSGTAVASTNTAGVPVVDLRTFVRVGTAQAGGNNSITLDAGASASDNFYVGTYVYILSGTGAGQVKVITGYTGSTKVATAGMNWITNPDNTSVFILVPDVADIRAITGTAVSTTTAQLGVNAVQLGGTTQTGRDLGTSVLLSSGTGTGQVSLSSGTVTIGTNNDKTGYGLSSTAIQAIWDALSSALTTVGSIGKRIVDNLTGDSYVRLGAPTGASVSADIATVTSYVDTEVAAIKAKTDNLPEGIKKNTAYNNFQFMMLDSSTLAGKTGLTDGGFTKKIIADAGSAATISGTITEVDSTNFPGLYKVSFTSGEMNGDTITIRFAASGCKDSEFTFKTSP